MKTTMNNSWTQATHKGRVKANAMLAVAVGQS